MEVDDTRLPASLHPPVEVALAREVDAIPEPGARPELDPYDVQLPDRLR
jgi:hypothetical protein